MSTGEILQRILSGDRRAIARAMTWVENEQPGAIELLEALYPHTGRAWRIGLTGPPGAGKSTLVAALTGALRSRGLRVGILAVDPTSPFTGGALLGDRIRMEPHFLDEGVFIRSLATRGRQGGLTARTEELADVLDAAGFDLVLIETVGVGQSELDVRQAADSVAVVLVPGSGDTVQAMKAGLMEIADLFILNKADHPEIDALERALKTALQLRPPARWTPPLLRTVATGGEGIEAVLEALNRHRAFLEAEGLWEEGRRRRLLHRVERYIAAEWERRFWTPERRARLEALLAEAAHRRGESPYRLARRILEEPSPRAEPPLPEDQPEKRR
jgi:LAO/AO transport system kinase|nr:MAG: GTPase [Bacteroidota bacterium]